MTQSIKAFIMAMLWMGGTAAWSQIYTCVDAKGRKLTSDRPILECIDREQRELNTNATVKRTVKPSMTAQEQRSFDDKQKAQAEEKARIAEDKRKDRALLVRYPNRTSHDNERAAALDQVDIVTKAAARRIEELAAQRKDINVEMEFYKKDPSKAPFSLKRQIEDNDNSVAAQKRFILDQELEKKRINARFDQELVRLKSLWLLAAGTASAPAAVEK